MNPAGATALDALRAPNFARLWAAQVISSFGDKITFFALAYVSWRTTGSALVTTLAFAVSITPPAVFGFFSGAIADAIGHRRAMVLCDLIRAALIGAIPLLLLAGVPLVPLYALVFVAALCAAIFNPARLAIVPEIVAPDQLGASNSLVNASDRSVEIGGSVLAGLVVGALGANAFYVDALSFVASAVLLLQIAVDDHPPRALSVAGIIRDAADGLRWIWRTPVLRDNTAVSLGAQLAIPVFNALTPVLVFREFGLGPAQLGIAEAALASGAVVMALLLPTFFWRRRKGELVVTGFTAFGVVLIAIAFATDFAVLLGLFALVGMTNVLFYVSNVTISQEVTPPSYRARVFGARMALLNLTWLPIVLGVGAVADHVSATLLIGASGLVTLAAAAAGAARPTVRGVA